MATQIDRYHTLNVGAGTLHIWEVTLITSGTTITFTAPQIKRVYAGMIHMNRTTGAIGTGSYTESTGVYLSPTMAVNDTCTVTYITD